MIKKKNCAACHLAHRSRQMEFGLGGCCPAAHKPAEADPPHPRHRSMEGMKNGEVWIEPHLFGERFLHQEVSRPQRRISSLPSDYWRSGRKSLRLNGGNSCTSVLPELMSYLSRRIGRAVIRLDPERNSAEDILYSKKGKKNKASVHYAINAALTAKAVLTANTSWDEYLLLYSN